MNLNGRRASSRPLALTLAAATAVGLLTAAAQSASAADPATPVASGKDWTVTQQAGGYLVSLTLPSALPVRDDIPELVVDGADLGPATESTNGRTLTVTTSDTAVASADSVDWQWSTGGKDTSDGTTTLPKAGATSKAKKATPSAIGGTGTTTDDPLDGTGAYTVADYNFGTQSIALANLDGVRGELEGRIYLPSTAGPHPLVVFLHGRHSSCYNTTTSKGVSGWPCPAGSAPILSYAGYDGAGDGLAAKGYTVVSISANSINANDGTLGADAGAVARGQLVLDSLTMLKAADAGDPVSYHDAATDSDVSLDQALVAGQSTLATPTTLTAADLKGTMDFDNIGLMGHSRGGEGVTTAGVLNEGLANPWHIKSIFNLAPIDFTRATLPDVDMATLLPYCDGDVSDQQGQHFYQDSRTAFGDNVLRSNIWVMGTDHDYYNTSWTPPYPGASDDWSATRTNDAVCGPTAPGTSRLSAANQFKTGSAYVAGFFELTLGKDTALQGMFDGSELEPPSVSSFADVRTVANQPASLRSDLQSFETTSPLVGTTGTATATICASRYGRTVPVTLAPCVSAAVGLTTQQTPQWTPASYAPNVPLGQMTHLTWTTTGSTLGVTVPAAKRDMSTYDEMTFDMSPDENVVKSTDMTVTVTDSSGHTWSSAVSALNPWGVTRMPTSAGTTTPGADSSGATLENKIVLAQVHVPTSTLSAAGVDTSHVAKVTFTSATGTDATAAGGVYLSDLGFDSKGLGTPSPQTRATVNVSSTTAEEGSGPATDHVAAYLSAPATSTVTTYLSVIGSTTGKVGLALQKLTFAPGQTCQSVEVPVTGDSTAGTTASTAYKFAVSDTTNAVLGKNDFGTITIREDDGIATTSTATPAPAVGVQGDVCAEHAALATPGTLTVSDTTPAPGQSITVGGTGYRNGESVSFAVGSTALGAAIAQADGTVSFTGTVPTGTPLGSATLTGVGAGSAYTSTVPVRVQAPTTTTLALAPSAPKINQAVTLTATVTGGGTTDGGTVTFSDGTTVLGAVAVSGGKATLSLPKGFKAGDHVLTASYAGTDTAAASLSNTVDLMLVKNASSIAVALTRTAYSYGQSVAGIVAVAGATEGTATVASGSEHVSVKINASGNGSFTLPGGFAVGRHTLTAQYTGTDYVAASGVASTTFTVAKAATHTALKASKATVAHGKKVTFTYTISGRTGGNYPTGTVTLTVQEKGKTVKTVKLHLSATGKGKGSVSVAMSPKGSASVTAAYGGDAAYDASRSGVTHVRIT